MSATQAPPTAPTSSVRTGRASFVNTLRAESTKLWTLRSTAWTLLALVLITVGFAVLTAWGSSQAPRDALATLDPTQTIFFGILFGQLAAAVLGALVICSEYNSGGIRTTLTATPNRVMVLAAKAVNFAVVMTVVGLISSFAGFFLGARFYVGTPAEVAIGDPHVLPAVIGAGLYLAGSGLFGLAVGVFIRKSAGAIAIAIALLLIVPIVLGSVPVDWLQSINKYLLAGPGSQVLDSRVVAGQLGQWQGFGIFCAEWFGLLVAGAVSMVRRDA